MAALRSQFFNCKQGPKQTLRSFALQVRELATRLYRRQDHGLGGQETLARDQFLLGLREGPVRQNLRLQLRQNPDLTFEQIRKEALELEQDHAATTEAPVCMAASGTARPPAPPAEGDWKRELRAEIMTEVREQMEELSKKLLGELRRARPTSPPLQERAYSDGGRGPQRHQNRPSGSRLQWDEQGRPICIRCGNAGHVSRQCGARRASQEGF